MFSVIRGFLHPHDRAQKTARRAVVVSTIKDPSTGSEWALVAPCTTWFARSGCVARGSVLVTDRSSAYAKTGFDAPQVLVSLRDAVVVKTTSKWLRGSQKIGVLNPSLDTRLGEAWKALCQEYPFQQTELVDWE